MKSDFNTIISNALLVRKNNMYKKVKNIIGSYKDAIDNNKDIFVEANKIDLRNNNGFDIDFDIFDRIFSNIRNEDVLYGKVTLSSKEDDIIYGKELLDTGNVLLINDGNTYTILEMILKNLLVCNTLIIVNRGYMYGTNHLLVELLKGVLEQYKIDSNLVSIFETDNIKGVLSKFANIDLVVCIGNHALQTEVLNNSKNRTIVSGYENFDIYIEDTTHMDFINKIKNLGLTIQYYVKDDIEEEFDNEIRVNDLDEAIAQINYNGSRYATCIFTSSPDNASRFIREVKSSHITVNTSPTIERLLDIETIDLALEKTIIYPNSIKLDGTREEIK